MNGAEHIAYERARQVDDEGWTAEHDASHGSGELLHAARCYLDAGHWADIERDMERDHGIEPVRAWEPVPGGWPWAARDWKPSAEPTANLIKAGALIAAEIDRLLAASPDASTEPER